jgi:hypothetical protein
VTCAPKTARLKTRRACKLLTRRERALFEGIAKGMSITDAARAAGYSQKWPGQAGHQALESIKQKAPNLFERHGLDDDTFIEKHIKPALEATETKAFLYKGRFVYSRPLVAWAPRVQMIRLVAQMMGLIVKEQETPNSGIEVILIDQSNRPQRPKNVTQVIDVPGLTPPVQTKAARAPNNAFPPQTVTHRPPPEAAQIARGKERLS